MAVIHYFTVYDNINPSQALRDVRSREKLFVFMVIPLLLTDERI